MSELEDDGLSELRCDAEAREECETGPEPWIQEGSERLSGNRLHLEDKRMQRERERERGSGE